MTDAEAVIAAARRSGQRIAVAESLTGGWLCSALVAVPGASTVVLGGVVAYATPLKAALLAVDPELLAQRGPVDPEVAEQMARGVREACAVDGREAEIGIATTGVAGPDPDPQTGQPAGTVWLGLSSAAGERAVRLRLHGDRHAIREAAVRAGVEALGELLRRDPGSERTPSA